MDRRAASPRGRRARPRHQPERRAPLQRAAGAVAHPPPRQPAEGRDRPPHRPVAADHHRRSCGSSRRTGWWCKRGAAAREDRPALGAVRAQSRRRLLARPQDRPAEQRPRAHGLRRAACATRCHETYRFPRPGPILDFVREGCRTLAGRAAAGGPRAASPASASPRRSSCGTGRRRSARRAGAMQAWRDFDITAEVARDLRPGRSISATTPPPPAPPSSSSATAPHHLDFLYVFIGWFIGGGVVLNGNLFPGRSGYAGALGRCRCRCRRAAAGASEQLLHAASTLRPRAPHQARPAATRGRSGNRPTTGARSARISTTGSRRSPTASRMRSWLGGLGHRFPGGDHRRRLPRRRPRPHRRGACEREGRGASTAQGLPPVAIVEGTIGSSARAIGGACLPLLAKFMRDREVLFREPERSAAAGPLHAARPSAF